MRVREIIAVTIRRNDWVLGLSVAKRHSAVWVGLGQRDGERVSSSVEMTGVYVMIVSIYSELVIAAKFPLEVSKIGIEVILMA